MNRTVICAILIFTTLSLVFSGGHSSSNAHGQGNISAPRMFILGSEDKSGALEIDLRAVQQGAQITQIKTFDITNDNVVQAKQGGGSITAFSSDPSLKIIKAKIRTDTAIENLRELQRTQANTFSLTGLVSGVYILDIIAQKDNRDLAYETIMVILDPGETTTTAVNLQIINNIITKVKTEVKTEKNIIKIIRGNGGGNNGGGNPPQHPAKCPKGSIWDAVEKICVIVDVHEIPQPPKVIQPVGDFKPDRDCWFNPDQKKCTLPDPTGDCPAGFARNEDAQCFKEGPCPEGYGRGDDDESGACYKNEDFVHCPNGDKLSPGWKCGPWQNEPRTPTPTTTPIPTTPGIAAAPSVQGCVDGTDEFDEACEPTVQQQSPPSPKP